MKPESLINIKLHMLDSKQKLVNPLIVTLCLILSSCGFQLNRNEQKLPLDAKEILIENVENQSYREGLGLQLQTLVVRELGQEKIQISSKKPTGLRLEIVVKDSKLTSANQEDLVTANYQFLFQVQAGVFLYQQGETKKLIWKKDVEGAYIFETAQSVLNHKEEKLGYQKALESLAPKIIELIKVNF